MLQKPSSSDLHSLTRDAVFRIRMNNNNKSKSDRKGAFESAWESREGVEHGVLCNRVDPLGPGGSHCAQELALVSFTRGHRFHDLGHVLFQLSLAKLLKPTNKIILKFNSKLKHTENMLKKNVFFLYLSFS